MVDSSFKQDILSDSLSVYCLKFTPKSLKFYSLAYIPILGSFILQAMKPWGLERLDTTLAYVHRTACILS